MFMFESPTLGSTQFNIRSALLRLNVGIFGSLNTARHLTALESALESAAVQANAKSGNIFCSKFGLQIVCMIVSVMIPIAGVIHERK